jgi:hypothetical protein
MYVGVKFNKRQNQSIGHRRPLLGRESRTSVLINIKSSFNNNSNDLKRVEHAVIK